MPTDISLARAHLDDAGAILTVQRAAYVTEAQRYRDPFLPPLTETMDELSAVLRGDTIVLVARLGARIVGADNLRLYRWYRYVEFAHRPDGAGPGLIFLEKWVGKPRVPGTSSPGTGFDLAPTEGD